MVVAMHRTVSPLMVGVALQLAGLGHGAITLDEFMAAFRTRAGVVYSCSQAPLPPTRLFGDYGCELPGGAGPCTWSCDDAADGRFQQDTQATWDSISDDGPPHCQVANPGHCGYFAVEVMGAADSRVRARIELALGRRIGPTVGKKFYVMFGDKDEAQTVLSLDYVDGVIAIPWQLKLSTDLKADIDAGRHTRMLINLSPTFSDYGSAEDLAQFWSDTLHSNNYPEATFTAEGSDIIALDLSRSTANMGSGVEIVSRQPEAMFMEPEQDYYVNNTGARKVMVGGLQNARRPAAQSEPFYEMGITGKGQIVGSSDSGLDRQHCMFTEEGNPIPVTQRFNNAGANSDWTTGSDPDHRKVVSYYAHADDGPDPGQRDHGTHVVGSVAGLAEGSQEGAGAAYEAKLTFFDIGVDGGLTVPRNLQTTIFKHGYDTGARVHTNSWGANTADYTSNARDVDAFMYDNDDFLILVAAGNSGRNGARSVGTPATCKNGISVGATNNIDTPIRANGDPDDIAVFSSIGPSAANMINPHIVAPGAEIMSANSNTGCGVIGLSGTSMATPLTAGVAAMVRQYYVEGHSPYSDFVPSGALLKATILHSGRAMTGATNWPGQVNGAAGNVQTLNDPSYSLGPPSIVQGFGRVDISNVVPFNGEHTLFVRDSRKDADAVIDSTGSEVLIPISVETAGSPLKVTLTWTDPPGVVNSQEILVNDLDLTLVDPSGNEVLPMTLNLGQGGENGPSNLGGPMQGVDRLNNVEQVQIPDATAGDWSIKIRGDSVPEGPQKFAVVATGTIKKDSRAKSDLFGSLDDPSSVVIGVVVLAIVVAAIYVIMFTPKGQPAKAWIIAHTPAFCLKLCKGADLPPDWESVKDPATGDTYYANVVTGETSWERPEAEQKPTGAIPGPDPRQQVNMYRQRQATVQRAAHPHPQPAAQVQMHRQRQATLTSGRSVPPLPAGWSAVVDPASGDTYYENIQTGQTQWEKPVARGAPALPPVPQRREAPAMPARREAPALPARRQGPALPARRQGPALPARRQGPQLPARP